MIKEAPYFSIIIPTKNRPDFLHRAIASVLSQKYSDYELIVVNDHSEYDIDHQISSIDDERITLLHHTGKERSAARNAGIRMARGRYVCFLDDDDAYEPAYLEDFYHFYESTGNRNFIIRTGFQRIRGLKKIKSLNYIEASGVHPVQFFADHMCGVWSLAIPREYLITDDFPEDFPHWQDTHLILRLLAQYPFHQLDSYNYRYYIHDAMGSSLAMRPDSAEERLQLNIDAVNHLFEHYGLLLTPFLKPNAKRKIIAGKHLHFASGVLTYNKKGIAFNFLKRSLRYGLYFHFWKYYGFILKALLWPFK